MLSDSPLSKSRSSASEEPLSPVFIPDSSEESKEEAKIEQVGEKPRILVANDNFFLLTSIEEMMTPYFDVSVAENGY